MFYDLNLEICCLNKQDDFLLPEMFEPLCCVLLTQEDLIPMLVWRQTNRDQVKKVKIPRKKLHERQQRLKKMHTILSDVRPFAKVVVESQNCVSKPKQYLCIMLIIYVSFLEGHSKLEKRGGNKSFK